MAHGDAGILEEIVVTGSRIARDEYSSPAPLSVYEQDDLINSGVVTLDEFLMESPSFTGFQHSVGTNYGGTGLKAVSLRGLGTKRTLVLINGRRQVGSFIGGSGDIGAVDLNTIPHAIIERVEVLKDGASTIYGSDALAGVVNVILKREFQGVQLRGSYGAGARNFDAKNHGLSATAGLAGERGRVLISAEFSKQEELLQAERAWALTDDHPIRVDGVFVSMASGSSNSRRIRTTEFDATGNAALAAAGFRPGQQFILDANSGQPRPFTASDAYNYAPVNALITPNERRQLSAIGAWGVTPRVTAFAEAFYTHRRSHQRLAPDASFALTSAIPTPNHGLRWNDFVPASNPANPFGQHPANPFGISGQHVRINRRFVERGGRLFQQSVDTWRFVAGLSGSLAGRLNWEASYVRAENKDTEQVRNYGRFDRWAIVVDPSACRAVAECVTATGGAGYLNPFGAFGTLPASVFDFLGIDAIENLSRNEMETFSVTLSGDFVGRLELSGGPVAWSAGLERREESARFTPDSFVAEGLTTSGAASPLAGGFRVGESYAEALLPFRDDFSMEASLRHSDYDTVGRTTTYRAGALFSPTDALDLRATWSTGFRAANVVELFGGDQSDFPIVEDPCEFFDLRPDPDGHLARNCAAAGFGPGFEWGFQYQAAHTATAPPPGSLKPEESRTLTLGGAFSPGFLPGMTLGMDYWRIRVAGYIAAPPYNSLLRNCLYAADQAADPACAFFTERTGHAGGVPDDAIAPLANLGLVRTEGIDINLRYGRDVRVWLFDAMEAVAEGTWLRRYDETFPAAGSNEWVGRIGEVHAYPEIKATFRLSLDSRYGSVSASARYISAMDDFLRPAFLTDDALAEAIWYHDLYFNFNIGERMELAIGVTNITDEEPPQYHSAINADTAPGTYDTIGRRAFISSTLRF